MATNYERLKSTIKVDSKEELALVIGTLMA